MLRLDPRGASAWSCGPARWRVPVAGVVEGGGGGEGGTGGAGGVRVDEIRLADVGGRVVAGGGQDLDGAGLDAGVAAAGDGVGDRDVVPGQGVEGVEQAGLVVFGRQ